MSYFPLFMTMKERPVLVVGGDVLAARKTRLLAKASAHIHVMAVELCCELQNKADTGHITWIKAEAPDHIAKEYAFVVSATDHDKLDQLVSQKAREANIPVNVVDRPELSDFIFPAIIDRSPVMVAVSSGGTAPVLARRIRGQIETLLPANLGRLASLSEKFRGAVKSLFPSEKSRRLFWERYFDGDAVRNFLSGDETNAQEKLLKTVNDLSNGNLETGRIVYVDGDLPNVDLLSLRAFRALQNADLIISDLALEHPVVDLARRDSERLFTGERHGQAVTAPTIVNRILKTAALEGQIVVRLMASGIDYSQEQSYLAARNIEVVKTPRLVAEKEENEFDLPALKPAVQNII